MGDFDGALEVYQILLERFPNNHVFLTYVRHHLGLVHQNKNAFDEGIVHYEKAIDIRRSLMSVNEADRHSVTIYANLSTFYVEKGDLSQGRKYCGRALALCKQFQEGNEYDPIVHCHHLENLAFIQHAEKNFEDSLLNYQQVIKIRLKCLPAFRPDLAVEYSNLAVVYVSVKNHSASIDCLRNALSSY